MTKLVMISGSLRANSTNSAVIRAAARIAGAHADVTEVEVLPLRDIPFYDGDVEATVIPDTVLRAREIVASADAVLISTPAYNGAPSGVLKNALDWLSRPQGQASLGGKLAATMSASPSPFGALDSQQELRRILTRCGATVIETDPLAISNSIALTAETGELTDTTVLDKIAALVDVLVATAVDDKVDERQDAAA